MNNFLHIDCFIWSPLIILGIACFIGVSMLQIDSMFNYTVLHSMYLYADDEYWKFIEKYKKLPRIQIRWFPAFICSLVSALIYTIICTNLLLILFFLVPAFLSLEQGTSVFITELLVAYILCSLISKRLYLYYLCKFNND